VLLNQAAGSVIPSTLNYAPFAVKDIPYSLKGIPSVMEMISFAVQMISYVVEIISFVVRVMFFAVGVITCAAPVTGAKSAANTSAPSLAKSGVNICAFCANYWRRTVVFGVYA